MSVMRKAIASRWHMSSQPSPGAVPPSSHSSPISTTPLPHTGAQSLSVLALAPGGQQPSPSIAWVIAV
jgi:hypothetical protein